jgi:hypothetical protein
VEKSIPIIPVGKIESRILLIRGERVVIDSDLADFYGVPTKRLNEQVKRNSSRFPKDFMFQLNQKEKKEVVAKCDHLEKLKYSKSMPNAFTEHGAIMAASVLNTPRAVEVSVFVVRAFIKLRKMVTEQDELQQKLSEIESHLADHDDQIIDIINLIKQFLEPEPIPPKRRIGF